MKILNNSSENTYQIIIRDSFKDWHHNSIYVLTEVKQFKKVKGYFFPAWICLKEKVFGFNIYALLSAMHLSWCIVLTFLK